MRILLFFHGGSKNRGCEAIVRTAVNLLKQTHPEAIVNLASFDPLSDQGIPNINAIYNVRDVVVSKFSLTGFIAALQYKFFKNEIPFLRAKHQKLIELIPSHDLFLSVGGDNYCYGEQPWLYEIDRLIKKAGKKLVLWGASIGEEDLSENKIKDLQSFDLILARESLTYQILKSHGLNRVQLIADGAFLLEKEIMKLPLSWQEGATIGINYSPLVYARNPQSKTAVIQLIQHILDATKYTIALLPHVIIDGNNDYEILQELKNEFKDSDRVLLLPNDLNAVQYKGYISKMQFFIGARTHATIAAYSCLVPTMVLGYSVKSKGIAMDLFGEEKLVLDIKELSNSNLLISKWEELHSEASKIKEVLALKIPEIQKLSQKAASYLKDIY
jgi:colanic acid/amylovoran biosynthesis protein